DSPRRSLTRQENVGEENKTALLRSLFSSPTFSCLVERNHSTVKTVELAVVRLEPKFYILYKDRKNSRFGKITKIGRMAGSARLYLLQKYVKFPPRCGSMRAMLPALIISKD